MREKLVRILKGELDQNPVMITNLFPKFIKVTNKGQANFIPQLEGECFYVLGSLYLHLPYSINLMKHLNDIRL